MQTKNISQGSKEWHELRERATKAIPGQRSALYFFVSQILGLKDKIPTTPLAHYPLCLFIEKATGIPEIDNCTYQLIQAPRGLGKSAFATNGRTTQELCMGSVDPEHEDRAIAIFNETQTVASKFLGMIKANFQENELVQGLFPEIIPDFDKTKWSGEEIVLKRKTPRPGTPSVLAAGVGATRTGIHCDKIIVDDMLSEDLADNAIRGNTSEIEKMERWIPRLQPLLNSPTRDPITFIGTPWWANDTYSYVERFFGDVPQEVDLDDAPKEEFNWTLKLPSSTESGGERISVRLYKRGDLAVFRRPALVDGRSIFPERYTKEELHQMSQKPGVSQFFHAQYLLDPVSGEDTVFDEDWLQPYAYDGPYAIRFYDQQGKPKRIRIDDLTTFISVDAAFSDKQSAARTAIPVVGTDGQHLFLLEDFAERGLGSSDIAEQVSSFAFKYGPQRIYVETIGQQKALMDPINQELRRENISTTVEEIGRHSQQNKDARIWGMDRYFKKRIFYVHSSHQNFKQEYSAFPRGAALRDVLDALSFMLDGFDTAMRMQGRQGASQDEIQEGHQRAVERIRQELQ